MKNKLHGILTLLLAFVVQITFAQEMTVTGTVTDDQGLPLPGVTVLLKGSNTGTQTDFDGEYQLSIEQSGVLVFSYVGFTTQEVQVNSAGAYNVEMGVDAAALNEVVVVAYGTQNKKTLLQSLSKIDSEDLEDVTSAGPQDMLQGQAAGVQVVNSSGVLGSAPTVKIRGVASISSGSRPLFVVDGVPLNDANQTTAQGGQALNPLNDINPNDIESMTVLKDAAATAVYGSRGANGVVLITTKTGKQGQATRVTLDMSTSVSESTDIFNMMSADQYRQFEVDAGFADSTDELPQGNFDWADAVTRTGFSKNIDASVSGGGEKTGFYLGTTFSDQEGFIIGNELDRRSVRLNLNHEATDWLNVGASLGYSNIINDRVGAENSTFAPMTSAFLQQPWVEPYNESGDYVNTGFVANVLAIEDLDINDAKTTRFIGNVFAEADLYFDGLTFRTDLGVDRYMLEEQERSFEINSAGGYARNRVAQQNKWILTNTLNYNTTIGDDHNLNGVAGMSYEQIDTRQIEVEGTGFLSDELINVTSASDFSTTSSEGEGSRLYGIFARAGYNYDEKYIVEGSIRRDGSSRFGQNNRFGNFWSVAGGWVISDEEFLANSDWLSLLKLTGSYGTSGNDRIGNYASLESFEGGAISNYNGNSGLRQLSAANPDLKWERSKSFNIGLSTGFFNNRVALNVEYYKKKTTDLILNVPIPVTNGGINSITDNVGSMENRGFDISLNTVNIDSDNFSWRSSLNVGINENEVLSLPGASVDNLGRQFVTGSPAQRAIVGESVNTFYLIRYAGVNPETGDAEWLTGDGERTTSPTASTDRVIVGDANPDFVGGFRNTFKYKNFDLNVFFNFSYGNDILVDGLRFVDNPNSSFGKRTELLNIWEQPGDQAYIPSPDSPTFATFAQQSTNQLRDGSFARLKNLTLGYTFTEQMLGENGFLKGLRLYFTANNLLTIKGDNLDGIDPEVTDTIDALGQGETFFTAPQSKTYLFGARFNF
jgi:TonB-linked SusC/RagA family outer membrane protein